MEIEHADHAKIRKKPAAGDFADDFVGNADFQARKPVDAHQVDHVVVAFGDNEQILSAKLQLSIFGM